jgi:hypothetical protein
MEGFDKLELSTETLRELTEYVYFRDNVAGPRLWPAELTAREIDPFVRPSRGVSLADDEPTAS